MISQGQARFLHFDNVDTHMQSEIFSRCNRCQQEFRAKPKPGENIFEVIERIRAQYEVHNCSTEKARG
jgi:cytochrome c2